MKLNLTLVVLLLVTIIACKESSEKKSTIDTNENKAINADGFLINETQANVMLLGTWHFTYPNNDSHKVKESNMRDLRSKKKQAEILAVVKRLQAFKPTIICIESRNQHQTDSLYNAYLLGNYQLEIGEDEQIGFRLAKRLGHKKVHAVDAYGWLREEYKAYPKLDDLWDEEYYLDTLDMLKWSEKYDKFYSYTDSIEANYTVEEALRYTNHPENIKRRLGHYLIQMKTSNHNGPDAYALKWYDRNVRIFNNILKTNPKNSDRILAIFGASHVSILEQLFDVSPQFELVRPYEY